jgi:Domain of Unknown Function (DUF1080)
MIKLLAGGIILLSFASCNNSADSEKKTNDSGQQSTMGPVTNALSDEEKNQGWQLLFDGQSTKGWHKYGGGPVGSGWKIADGTIYVDTSDKVGGGDIATNDDYDNFDLKLEWKISVGGNSGIMFYVNEDTVKYKHPYESGPEMQVVDNVGHSDGKIMKHKAGDLYDLVSCNKEVAKPAGEWNKAEIKCVNGKLDLYLNDENVVTTMLWDDNWAKMVAGSKFKEWPGFGTFKKGKIDLQDHGGVVWYRNIRVKRL